MPRIGKAPFVTTISMSRVLFVDTGAFIALANRSDQYHEAAKGCLEKISAPGILLVTSNFVLDETYTRIRRRAGLPTAVAFGTAVRSNRQLKVITVERKSEEKAWEIFKKYDDHSFSYTDCTSFALMQQRKIKEAFAFDQDFKIFGFQVIPLL